MPAPPSVQKELAAHLKPKKAQTVKMDYLLFLPKGYDAKSEKRWPLIFFLHGSGERGTNIWKVAIHGPPKGLQKLDEFPFIIVSPQCPEGRFWSNDTLLALLDEITRKYSVATNRIYLTGLSMGGYGAWDLGLAFPEKFAALAPICGGGEMVGVILSGREKPEAFKTLPVWAFHGAKDDVVPVEESQRMVDALKKAGVAEVKLTVYPGVTHNSWTQTYENPELYEWFLQHERKPQPAAKSRKKE
jgi:predicted peptidase